jgi:hypothetical protein
MHFKTGIASSTCPLCRSHAIHTFECVQDRQYIECEACELIHMTPRDLPNATTAFARYQSHENDPKDEAYRRFLDRLAVPLVGRLPPGAEGLDYGSGPGPTLSIMLEQQGFTMSIYDPFFSPDSQVLDRSYDFVTCTETAEHFFEPGKEFEKLNGLVRPGGWLAVMTELFRDQVFVDWRYVRDETHVAFYRQRTMQWIAEWLDWSVSFPGKDVVIFRKPIQ